MGPKCGSKGQPHIIFFRFCIIARVHINIRIKLFYNFPWCKKSYCFIKQGLQEIMPLIMIGLQTAFAVPGNPAEYLMLLYNI